MVKKKHTYMYSIEQETLYTASIGTEFQIAVFMVVLYGGMVLLYSLNTHE